MFEEIGPKFYSTEKECMVNAEMKAIAMVKTYEEFGYYIESNAYSCQYVDGQTEV
jgi:hypothetical protein